MRYTNSASRTLTIIALTIEGLFALGLFIFVAFLFRHSNWELAHIFSSASTSNLTEGDGILAIIMIVFFILAMVLLPIFIVNLVLYTFYLRGKFGNSGTKGIYIYQIVYGIIFFLFGHVLAILYLISGALGLDQLAKLKK